MATKKKATPKTNATPKAKPAPKATGLKPLGSFAAVNSLLTPVLLDGSFTTAWEPLLDEPEDDDLGGHPQKIHDFYDDDDFTHGTLKVGKGKALVVTLEGQTGEAEVYRLDDGTILFAEPPRSWWNDEDNYGSKKADVEALFTEAIAPPGKSAKKVGKLELPTGKLVAFDGHADLKPVAKTLKTKAALGDVSAFGRDDGGVVITLKSGTYVVRRRVLERKWARDQPLVIVTVTPS